MRAESMLPKHPVLRFTVTLIFLPNLFSSHIYCIPNYLFMFLNLLKKLYFYLTSFIVNVTIVCKKKKKTSYFLRAYTYTENIVILGHLCIISTQTL